jgi:hypothetical protein
MTIVITTAFPDDDLGNRQRSVGGLGSFRKVKKRFGKITKPIGRIAKPLLSMTGGGGGLLTAMGPWGWAAGAAMAAGGALANRHRQKKLKAKQRKARRAAIAQASTPEAMPTDYAMPQPAPMPEQVPEQMEPPPGFYPQPDAATMPTEPPAEDAAAPSMSEPAGDSSAPPPETPSAAVMVLPSNEPPEIQAVLDPEPVTMAGLGNAPGTVVGIDWRALSVFAGFTLGTWWLLRDRRPSPRSRRR